MRFDDFHLERNTITNRCTTDDFKTIIMRFSSFRLFQSSIAKSANYECASSLKRHPWHRFRAILYSMWSAGSDRRRKNVYKCIPHQGCQPSFEHSRESVRFLRNSFFLSRSIRPAKTLSNSVFRFTQSPTRHAIKKSKGRSGETGSSASWGE